ncbi:helix-turn-helix domain-containing protein [Ruegeria conchae]|uniref:helix-turn-helix domain-containing protein n=1 Tax=Ruegeria conchae TaxID=981384 RepID=UPI0029C989D5|nr:helix-turn-helix domain-containing protein [Ruegeria conchae]
MAKSFPAHKVKSHLVYTVWEAADVLGCHRQTVIRWIRNNGLAADTSRKPWLIEGHVLKEFLGHKQSKARCKLALHHCYCLSCRGPREPDGKIADYVQETASSGRLTALWFRL